MKKLIYIVLFFALTAFAWHKFYVSVTEVEVKPHQLDIIMRVFPDDIANVLEDHYHIQADLSKKQTKIFLKDYLQSHFVISIDGQTIAYRFLGTTMEDNFLVILLQADLPTAAHQIRIKNTVLQDKFEAQKNIIHFIRKTDKQSFILIKSDPVAIYEMK